MSNLQDRAILLVEDNYFIATELVTALHHRGAIAAGPVPNVERGLALLQTLKVDGAILDLRLGENNAFPLADLLITQNVPFIFYTAISQADIPKHFLSIPYFQKPEIIAGVFKRLGHLLEMPQALSSD